MANIIVQKESTRELVNMSQALKRLGLLIELIYDPANEMFTVTLFEGGDRLVAERAATGMHHKLPVAFQLALNGLYAGPGCKEGVV